MPREAVGGKLKQYHEIRDPIHDFVRLDNDERRVLDSGPVQRLRHVHQLAMSYLVYPGATHRRFEHSLGVMELAGRVFDVVTADHNIHPLVREVVPEIARSDSREYWRKVLRMAALCHDIGHLPFSHAAESELLPNGWSHERLTAGLVLSDEMKEIWRTMRPPIDPGDVAKIAVGPEKMKDVRFSNLEALLSEVIISDTLGVDRMDYLLRDSHHAGVAYGKFDHYRLVDTIRVLPSSERADDPALGIEGGGIHAAEAMLLARYFMFMQVYYHRVRLAYDYHLQQFLQAWLPCGRFSTDTDIHQRLDDNEVLHAISMAVQSPPAPGHEAAHRIVNRRPFRQLYSPTREDKAQYEDPLTAAFEVCVEKYSREKVHMAEHTQSRQVPHFPVLNLEGEVVSSHRASNVLQQIPIADTGVLLIDPEIYEDAVKWFGKNRGDILSRDTGG